MSVSRKPGEAQAVTPDLALVKDEMAAEEYDMSQHGQELGPPPDLSPMKYEIQIEDHGLVQHLQPDLSRVKYEIEIEEHDVLQQKYNLNSCKVEQASQPGSSARPELSVVKVEADAQELLTVQGTQPPSLSPGLLVERQPLAAAKELLADHKKAAWTCRAESPMKEVTEKKFKCDQCKYGTGHRRRFKEHMRTHTGEKPFKCNKCEYKCAYSSTLRSHMVKHSTNRQFHCDLCDYKSKSKSGLVKHMKTHTGEKPFKCDQCDYRTIRNSQLKHHIKIHTGEKPFHCNQCQYKSRLKNALTRHMKTHSPLLQKPKTEFNACLSLV